jgi:uncharacterized membrane protein
LCKLINQISESSFLGAYFFVTILVGVLGASFEGGLFPENSVLANFCLALSSGVIIAFLGFISGWIKVFGFSGEILGFVSGIDYYFFLNFNIIST